MATIGFIGLGNMGAPMAANLIKAGHRVIGFDINAGAVRALASAGVQQAISAAEAVRGADIVITMLPAGQHVREVWLHQGGLIEAVSDTEILQTQIRLASSEGLFAEPASCAPLALLFRLVQEGRLERDSTTVVVLTGSGLKDPDAAISNVAPPVELDGDARALAKILKL